MSVKRTKMHQKAQQIKELLLKHSPNQTTELHHKNPYELLVATILSAQCTDARVNIVTPKLFEKYPSVNDLALASLEEVKEIIKSVSYFNNKSKHLINMAQKVVRDFNGVIPSTQKELMGLDGVGQKTANVVLSVCFDANCLAVDTHVFRATHRLGLSDAKTPIKTEEELSELFKDDLSKLHHALILFGRYTCKAKNPLCDACFLTAFCISKARFKA
ncbi:endonuclease III [Helicobacter acinonychis]|uniref:Endonuclease III n=1 Tax=Helicobacter acinonychis (strain Sheeba) TaxID=382638 RepID=Q17W21_HELAH|nr:endonuclease III [Helicobacter acinonychis]CAK00155.1 endonuclease III [Helicobacter acinonychis str. Sheeba]STP03435.1 endonuclease III [Helicobacter acinonychis]